MGDKSPHGLRRMLPRLLRAGAVTRLTALKGPDDAPVGESRYMRSNEPEGQRNAFMQSNIRASVKH